MALATKNYLSRPQLPPLERLGDGRALVRGLPLLKAGTWNDVTFTPDDFAAAVRNFRVLRDEYAWQPGGWSKHYPPEYGPYGRDATDRLATIEDLRLEGDTLYSDLLLLGEDAVAAYEAGKLVFVSAETDREFRPISNQDVAPLPGLTIAGLAWVDNPAVKGLGAATFANSADYPELWDEADATAFSAATEALQKAQKSRSRKYRIEVRADGNLTAPGEYVAQCPNAEDYGDPVNYLYPLLPETRLRNAAARMAQNYGQYAKEMSRSVVWSRTVRRMKEHGVEHKWGSPEALDRLLPEDLQAWAKENAGVAAAAAATTGEGAATMAADKDVKVEPTAREQELETTLATVRKELAEAQTALAALTDQAEALAAAQTELETLRAALAAAEDGKTDADKTVETLAARVTTLENDLALTRATAELSTTDVGDGKALTPEAVATLAAARVNPNAETMAAVQGLLFANKGVLPTVPSGNKPALQALSTPPAGGPEEWLASKECTDDVRARTLRYMKAKGTTVEEAYDLCVFDRNAGR